MFSYPFMILNNCSILALSILICSVGRPKVASLMLFHSEGLLIVSSLDSFYQLYIMELE